jgi:hypothetical protein
MCVATRVDDQANKRFFDEGSTHRHASYHHRGGTEYLTEVVRLGQTDHEPRCLVKGLRQVVDHQVELQFHKVVPAARRPQQTRHDEAHATAFARSFLDTQKAVRV